MVFITGQIAKETTSMTVPTRGRNEEEVNTVEGQSVSNGSEVKVLERPARILDCGKWGNRLHRQRKHVSDRRKG